MSRLFLHQFRNIPLPDRDVVLLHEAQSFPDGFGKAIEGDNQLGDNLSFVWASIGRVSIHVQNKSRGGPKHFDIRHARQVNVRDRDRFDQRDSSAAHHRAPPHIKIPRPSRTFYLANLFLGTPKRATCLTECCAIGVHPKVPTARDIAFDFQTVRA